ncbi:FERM, ARHGEF and pleckstrin domain-containing protein 1 isoform X4 [Toxorhynchites rutilus septentrionalis]|uniref:FERM, ARHGEF and pleckstrin domain-containing protein 1 isoform X4 n=2 Tax=Toxorhynchites rutilus septentrionalis TaxID=329112 RepID=UPI0024784D5A|nr:FERM, ARHGEF and pleckstrin domain-containing protein 1 isoform X4 [Toxorhynchites rutilus septentrionalis]
MSLDSMGPSTVGAGGSGPGTLSGTRMIHSLSTPSGVDGGVSSSHSRGGKKLAVRIQMLDDTVTMFQVQAKALGKVLFEQVCRQLNLLEADYFGLEYQEAQSGTKYWLDLEKALNRQVGLSLIEPMLRFCVKFYTPDPLQLEEEYTRYLFCLQVKRDLATGSLQCNDNTAALMASYIVQASCGDYAPEDYPDHTYLSSYRFVPQQDYTMQRRIMENHKKHIGQSPAEADLNLLETARRCELYGMKMHPAKDHEGVPLNLAVAHMGIAVFQGITRINTFSWAKIRKISFKRKKFLIKLHPENYMYHKDTVEFFFEGRNECKNFWKKCVENHGFFRCSAVQSVQRRKARVLSRGSSFRYSGKTQKQIIEFVRGNYVKRQTFQSGMGASQSEQRLEDAFSDEETSGYGGGSPTRQSYRPQSFSAHGSPGGDLSDEELCPNGPGNGLIHGGGPTAAPPELEPLCLSGGHMEFAIPAQQQQQQPCARSRSGSCTSRRSQFRSEPPPLCHYVPQLHSSQPQICHAAAAASGLSRAAGPAGGSQQFYGGDNGLLHQPGECFIPSGHSHQTLFGNPATSNAGPIGGQQLSIPQCHTSPL